LLFPIAAEMFGETFQIVAAVISSVQ
jgi:hypothetical protein